MTPEILRFLREVVKPVVKAPAYVFEVGSMDVNGTARASLQEPGMNWVGCDLSAGPGVDLVGNATEELEKLPNESLDMVVSCECYEHDLRFMLTNHFARAKLKKGGYYVVSTPTTGFPEHRYPKDYYRFMPDAYRELFFHQMQIIDLRVLDDPNVPRGTLAGFARK